MMRFKRKFGWVLLIVFCLAVLLVPGCSKKDGEDKTGESVFRYPLPVKIKCLDTGNVEDVYGSWVVSQICESLYTYHYLKRPFVLEPFLADGMPVISEDKLTYTIPIKQGVYFQDDVCFPNGKGRELKADDFVYAFKRIANVRYASVNWGGFKDRVVGLDDFREYTKQFKNEFEVDYSPEIEGLRAIDDYTLQIKLVKPWPQLLDDLTSVVTAPVAKEAVDYYQKDIIAHPVGTGPYYLKTWHRGVYLELVKNPTFRQDIYPTEGTPEDVQSGLLADAGKKLPLIDRIIFRIIEEEQPMWLLFMRGELDFAGIPKDNFSSAVDLYAQRPKEEMRQRNIQLAITDQPSLYYYGFNMRDPVLGKNKPLREALCRAIDCEKINELFYNGRWRVAHSLIHPLMNEYDPNIVNQHYMRYDPEEAKKLIVEAEKINGGPIPELVIGSVGGSTFLRQFGQFIEREIEDVGLQVRSDYTDWPTYMGKMNKGQLQILGGGGVRFSAPDALGVLSMFATKYFAPLGNSFFYSNKEYDRLYDQAEVMFPCPERTELYRKMERMVLDDYPAIFTNHRVQYDLYHGWLENHKPHPFLYGFMKYIRIDSEKQKAYKTLLKELKQKKKDE
jgi:ABC-type transport system substrate-binding protein